MRRIATRRRGGPSPRLGRKARVAALVLLALIVAALLVLYGLAGHTPAYYRPARLDADQRDLAMREFRRKLMDFSNKGQDIVPFAWSVTQVQLNNYLAAMDEIAVQGGAESGEVRSAMASAGLSEPAVALDDGRVRLMARSVDYDRIISIDIGMRVGDGGLLHVTLDGARVGKLPLPPSMVRSLVDRLRDKIAEDFEPAEADSPVARLDAEVVALMIRQVLTALDGDPILPEFSWQIRTRKRVRVRRIDIEGGTLTLHVEPVRGDVGEKGNDKRP